MLTDVTLQGENADGRLGSHDGQFYGANARPVTTPAPGTAVVGLVPAPGSAPVELVGGADYDLYLAHGHRGADVDAELGGDITVLGLLNGVFVGFLGACLTIGGALWWRSRARGRAAERVALASP